MERNGMSDYSPLVSIVLPTYNCAEYLPCSIGSILAQTYNSYETIVIDDGSIDITKEVLSPFMQKIKYIKLGKNKGLPTVRNVGIQAAQGKYIAFIDADDIWLPEKLSNGIEFLETNPEFSMVYSRHVNIDNMGNTIDECSKRQLPSGNIFTQLFTEQNFIITSSVLVLKKVFDTVGLFDTKLFNCQDWDMWLRIAFYFKVASIDKVLVKYRHNPRSLSKDRNNVLKYQKIIIDKTYNEFKEKDNGISEKLYKKRLASHYAKAGRHYLRLGDKNLANENLRLSLKYNLFNFRTIRYYLLSIF